MEKVWVLTKTESYGTQCTGFPDRLSIIAIFGKKPSVKGIAPYIGGLSRDMGEAIGQVMTLVDEGYVSLSNDIEYSLTCATLNARFLEDDQ
jgi:hypothetical protein